MLDAQRAEVVAELQTPRAGADDDYWIVPWRKRPLIVHFHLSGSRSRRASPFSSANMTFG